jgi:hypothetical protein
VTLQAGDPWALFDYKPISSEQLRPGVFRLLIPFDRKAYPLSQVAGPQHGAFLEWAERVVGPIHSDDFHLLQLE